MLVFPTLQVVEDLYGFLREMASDEEKRLELGRRARRWVRERWTWDRVGDRLHEMYEEVAGR